MKGRPDCWIIAEARIWYEQERRIAPGKTSDALSTALDHLGELLDIAERQEKSK